MKTNLWLLVSVLFEYETAPAKQKLCKPKASLIAGYDGTLTSFLHNHKSIKTSHKQCQNYQNCSTKTNPAYAAKTKTHFNQGYISFKTTHKPYSSPIFLHK